MKGALICWRLRKCSFSVLNTSGRSCGLSPFSTRRTLGARVRTLPLSSRVLSPLRGLLSASRVIGFASISLLLSLCFPAPAHASITLDAWGVFWAAMRGIDLVEGAWVTANAAEELQTLSAQISTTNMTRGNAQYIAQELEKVCGYNIDQGNVMGTVYGVTGNTCYDSEQQCPDCMGGYNYVDGQQVTCGTCGGDGTVLWSTIPYTASAQCADSLRSWISYLTATQTDWGTGDSGGSGSSATDELSYTLTFYPSRYKDWTFALKDGVTYHSLPNNSQYSVCQPFEVTVTGSSATQIKNGIAKYGSALFLLYHSNQDSWFWYAFFNDNFRYVAETKTVNGVSYTWAKDWYVTGNYEFLGNGGYYRYDGTVDNFLPTSTLTPVTSCSQSGEKKVFDGIKYYWKGGSSGPYCAAYAFLRGEKAASPAVTDVPDVGGGGTTVNYYDESTEDNSTTVTNNTTNNYESTTVYDEENNTYVTTYNNTTVTEVDLESVTTRLDAINNKLGQIGHDLGTLGGYLLTIDDDIGSIGSLVTSGFEDVTYWLPKIYAKLSQILNFLEDADFGGTSGGSADLSTLEQDLDALISSVTGSHGTDALGLYGRLDTVLNWLDSYSPVDLSNIEQTLEDWPEYPVFDPDGIITTITGSHGTDALGLYGRLDTVLNWLDSYSPSDLSDIETYLSTLLGFSTVTADGSTYSFADLLYNIWLDVIDMGNNLVEYWAEVVGRLDDVIQAIEDLPHGGTHTYPSEPSDPEGGPIIGPIDLDPYGYPKMPDWETYKEPLNIPALEHAIDELMTKFPFSMLNTLVQVAAYIERPAVAPQFDIPAPNPSDWSSPHMVHVDLSDYDTVAATLRFGIVIWAIVRISNKTIKMWMGDKAVE